MRERVRLSPDERRMKRKERVRIRRSKPGDFLAVAELDRVAWRRNLHSTYIPDGEHVWRLWCETALTFVAVHRAETIGAILAFPTAKGGYWLHKVMVAEPWRGQGIASALFDALLKRIDKLGVALALTVDPANDAALRLYAKWGFTRRRFVRSFYRASEDRYVLTRPARRNRNAD